MSENVTIWTVEALQCDHIHYFTLATEFSEVDAKYVLSKIRNFYSGVRIVKREN